MPHGQGDGRLTRRGRLVVEEFDWEDDVPPATPLAQTVIYELHVRGFTRHPSSGVQHPGTFLGLCEKIPYLKSLGVTAVQLMPVLEFDELDSHAQAPASPANRSATTGATRTLSFFAPKASYAAAAGQQVREFKEMVKAFHQAGIEVILDVVYNHTCEGNENGPTLSFRGLDNAIYYMLDREGRYYNFSGCGNTLNCNHPVVRDLILDSLTYLVAELHVDGFRFDLAAILGRGADGKVLEDPPLLRHIAEHPRAGRHQAAGRGVGRGRSVAAGQVPRLGPLGRVQRLVPRRRPPLHPRRRRRHRQRRQAHLRQPRPLRRRRAPSVPFDQFRHLPRRLHALRSGQLQPQAQPGQRREQPGRLERQPQLQLRPRRADATTLTSTPSASGRCATS